MLAEKTLSPKMGSYQTFYVIHTYAKKMFENILMQKEVKYYFKKEDKFNMA